MPFYFAYPSTPQIRRVIFLRENRLLSAIDKLADIFDHIDWKYMESPAGSNLEKTELWPGEPDEDVMICVYKGRHISQLFHRQNFFFFNFAYQGDYGALSYRFDNRIVVRQGECYIGQPGAGYAPNGKSEQEIIIIGVLIQKEAFFKTFFHALSANRKMFQFFLAPQTDEYSDEYIHLKFDDEYTIRCLLELMVIEYGNKTDDTQHILKPLVLSLFMQIARQYTKTEAPDKEETLCEKIVKYISEHYDTVTLSGIAAKFSYHPNYISSLLSKETGKKFSEILLEQRMERAASLLVATELSVEDIAYMLGYSNSSNFYKAFRGYYHTSPREYQND